MYRADETEELLYTNSAVLRIFGCETEEEFRTLTGYTFKGMVHPEDLDEVEQSIQIQIANSIYDFDYVEYRIMQRTAQSAGLRTMGILCTQRCSAISFMYL